VRNSGLAQAEHRVDVRREGIVPFVVGDLFQSLVGHLIGGVVHQHVEVAELVHGLLRHGPAVLRIGQVSGHQHGAATGILDVCGGVGRVLMFVEVGDQDVGTFSGERDGNRSPAQRVER